jgi:hypothetical protein
MISASSVPAKLADLRAATGNDGQASGARGGPAEQPPQEMPGLPNTPANDPTILIFTPRAFQD